MTTVLQHAISGTLNQAKMEWDSRAALSVVIAAQNYPNTPRTGDFIQGLPTSGNAVNDDVYLFHAGTSSTANNKIITSGGRVLCVTALGNTFSQARDRAYKAIFPIYFDGMQYRNDIGYHAINHSSLCSS